MIRIIWPIFIVSNFIFINLIIKVDHLYLLKFFYHHFTCSILICCNPIRCLQSFIIITTYCNLIYFFCLHNLVIASKSFLWSIYRFIVKQAIFAIFKHTFLFYYTLLCAFLWSLPSSIKYAYFFGLSATSSVIIFP